MNRQKVALASILFILGIIGIASILTMDIPLPPEAEAILKDRFTPGQIKLLTLINPTIMLVGAVIVGTLLHQKVNLHVPFVEKLVGMKEDALDASGILSYGITGGIAAGVLISLATLIFHPVLPAEFKEIGESLKPTLAARFLYGGLTEEILLRFGIMTLVVWIASKVTKGTSPLTYWTGIIIAAILFAIGHFPIAYQAVDDPSAGLLTYILIGNTVGGIVFGWLYWKKGLESAFIAHMFAHVVMLLAEPVVGA